MAAVSGGGFVAGWAAGGEGFVVAHFVDWVFLLLVVVGVFGWGC